MNSEEKDLFEANKGLVIHWIMRINKKFTEDLYQEGLIALWKAVQSYDKNKGEFSHYATSCITRRLRWRIRKDATQQQAINFTDLQDEGSSDASTIEQLFTDVQYVKSDEELNNMLICMLDKSDQVFFNFYLSGESISKIACLYHSSEVLVRYRINSIKDRLCLLRYMLRMGKFSDGEKLKILIKRGCFSKEELKFMRSLDSSKTKNEIAKEMGIPRSTFFEREKALKAKTNKLLKIFDLEDKK